jgi:hypothetical protein
MSVHLNKTITESRDGSSDSSTIQSSAAQRNESSESRTSSSQADEQSTSSTTTDETRHQAGERTENVTRTETREQTGATNQGQTRSQTQSGASTRALTSEGTGEEQVIERLDIGAVVRFSIKISGGLGTVPAGATPPASVC